MRIAIIPARGGSVRIPRKNIRPFRGKPIILYSIDVAKASGLFDQIWVSTDDHQIARLALSNGGLVFHRASDDGRRGTQDVAAEVLVVVPCEAAAVIYPTCPLLLAEDVHRCWAALNKRDACYAVTVGTEPLSDAGCVYFGWRKHFMEGVPLWTERTRMVPMPPSRTCDINTEEDWKRAEGLYDAMHG